MEVFLTQYVLLAYDVAPLLKYPARGRWTAAESNLAINCLTVQALLSYLATSTESTHRQTASGYS